MISTLAVIKPGWSFPVMLSVAGWRVPVHAATDVLAYSLGFQLYLRQRKRSPRLPLSAEQTVWILLSCIFGALIGAKILAWSEDPELYWARRHDPHFWLGGKTIVGGLLGGWAGIEIAKKGLGLTGSMGDACVLPLIFGMALGRIGCFLTGLADDTYGVPSNLPWAVDFGDGIPRHPTQLYEIVFLLGLGLVLSRARFPENSQGLKFRWFMLSYLAFRFLIDFLKPHGTLWLGVSGIQWACLVGLLVCGFSMVRFNRSISQQASRG